MSDIYKCTGRNCSQKTTCYRYLAKASEHQSYVAPFLAEEWEDGKCVLYCEVKANKESEG